MDIFRIIELCTVENMCLAELQEDALFEKIPAGEVGDYVDSIISIAAGKADDIKLKFKQKKKLISESPGAKISLIDICRSKGVSVNLTDGSRAQAGGRFRAEIYYDEKIINIMKYSIDQMYDALKNFLVYFGENKNFISVDNIKDMHIAHELYHLIEFTDGEYTPDLLPPVTSLNIFGFERRSGFSKASEAAAHIFCMRLLELPFHPKMLDYLCLLSAGEVTREKLIEFLEDLKIR
ncbi:MAG TPA: hypothetical protein DC017_09475 [Candidatus Wallbacteria bacterium]|nr:hypothetical protein [Candidatus Wallbacteria bacterium]